MKALLISTSSSVINFNNRALHGYNIHANRTNLKLSNPRKFKVNAISDVSATVDSTGPEVTWQIVVGAIAGVTPFVVAGVEFSKRIVAQRRCGVCNGSGLVMREKEFFRCPECGGFLPWQSWKRFFTG